MTTKTIRQPVDTWVGSGKPTARNGDAAKLQLQSGSAQAYVWFNLASLAGQQIASATLTLTAKGASSGARTVSASKVTGAWTASKTTWNNKPAAAGTATGTANIGTLADRDQIAINVTADVAAIAAGSANRGWLITTNATTRWYVYSAESAWQPTLTVVFSHKPAAPTGLAPAGVVATGKPMLDFDYLDMDGDDLAAVHVQIATSSTGFATPEFDSGSVPAVVPQYDLATSTYAGIPSGATRWWRVQVTDADGYTSPWSDPAQVTYTPLGALTITSPAGTSPKVTESTPPIIWSYAGTIAAWQVRIWDLDQPGTLLADSGVVGGSDTSWTIPDGIIQDTGRYQAVVRVRDGQPDRVANANADRWASAQVAFTFAETTTVATPTGVFAEQVVNGPQLHPSVSLTWSRSSTPDGWSIYRDGQLVATLDAADVTISGTTYTWVDKAAKPGRYHTWGVRAVVNGTASAKAVSNELLVVVAGIWVWDPDTGRSFVLSGSDVEQVAYTDQVFTQNPIGSTRPIQVTSSMYGLSGTITGILHEDRPGQTRTVEDMEADLWAIKAQPSKVVRVIWGDTNIPAVLSNVSCITAADHTSGRNPRKRVSFNLSQRGELPYQVRF